MKYAPLDLQNNEIRLLTVRQPLTDKDEPLVCTLEHVSLNDLQFRYQVFWYLKGLRRNYLARWIPAPLLSAGHDGVAFYGKYFLGLWSLANMLDYVVQSLDFFHPWIIRCLGVIIGLAQLVRNKHPDLLRYYNTAFKLRTELRQSWRNVISFVIVHCILFLVSIIMVHTLEFGPVVLGTLAILITKNVIWPVERYRPQLPQNEEKFRYTWGDYVALSYVWGSPTPTTEITVNGERMRVTENLGQALLSHRSSELARNGFRIWVDAICINQNDLNEREQQIKRMLAIYQKAFTVLIWLGKADSDSHLATKEINMVSFIMNRAYGSLARFGLSKAILKNLQPQTLKALGYFFARPYWMRMWIIQELSVVQDETRLICGDQSITWQGFCDMIDIFMLDWDHFYEGLRNTGDEIFQGNSFTLLTRLRTLKEFVHQLQSGSNIPSLGLLIMLCELSEATDNRDRVYGMLGLVDPAISARIHPDYRIGLQSIYTSFTQAVIEVTGDLSIIHGGNRAVIRDYNPTWVVDYRGGPNRWRPSFDDPSNACLGKKAVVSFSSCGNFLTAKGFMIDSVDGVSGQRLHWFTDSPQPSSIAQTTAKHHAYGNDEGLARALNRTLVGYRLPDSLVPPQSMLTIPWVDNATFKQTMPSHWQNTPWSSLLTNAWYNDFESFRQTNASFDLFSRPLRSFFPTAFPSLPGGTEPEHLAWPMSLAGQSIFGRKLITTSNGYLGLTVQAVQPGDRIFLLFGSKSPVVLRADVKYGGYRVVGEVYLAGCMNGEAMGRGKVEDVVLC